MGLAYSLKCSLLCSYFYSLAPLFSFSFPHVLAPRVSPIPPGHLASGTFLAAIPPEYISSGIPPRRHSTQIHHTRNLPASIPLEHIISGIPPVIPPECLTSRILLRRHSTRISHIRNPVRSPFRLLRMSHIRNLVQPPIPPSPDVSYPESCPGRNA